VHLQTFPEIIGSRASTSIGHWHSSSRSGTRLYGNSYM